MTVYLGLGSNLGNRLEHFENGIRGLEREGFRITRISPVVEAPAMLTPNAEANWNRPFLNMVVSGKWNLSPFDALRKIKLIERDAGREQGPRWSPRPLDIDILLWGDEQINEPDLVIPHPGMTQRDFVLTPLLHLAPGLAIPGDARTVFELSLGRRNIPLWMGILNLTPDSFSDGGNWDDQDELSRWIDRLIAENTQIIDIGAESTRPNAEGISEKEEWSRLRPVLELLDERLKGRRIRPRVSLDSRHPGIIEKGLTHGIDLINDVTGLNDPAMIALVRSSDCDVVAMHAMSVPVDPEIQLPADEPPVDQLLRWIEQKKSVWSDQGIDTDRIIFDPGIGFGKSSIQACELMSQVKLLRQAGLRLLIGHSRKSFMTAFTDRPAELRDIETLGMSLALAGQGTDIIRVHHPVIHQRAYLAWSHVPVRPA